MNVKIFHGENIVESRKALWQEVSKAKEKGVEVVTLNGAKTDLTEIRSALESSSLFGQDKLVILENFLSLASCPFKKKSLDYLKKGKFENSLILWEEKQLRSIPLKVPIKLFRLDPILFRFLESLRQEQPGKSLALLEKLKKKEKPEMIFYMIARQVRLLILAKDLGQSGLTGFATWQKQRLISQAKFFNLEHLIRIYKKLLEIDLEQKTSRDPLPLSSRLDLLVSEI